MKIPTDGRQTSSPPVFISMTKEFILRLWRTNPACGHSGALNSELPGWKFSAVTAVPYCMLEKH